MRENVDMPGNTLRTPDPKVLPGMARFSHMAVWLKQNLNARGAEPTPVVGAGAALTPGVGAAPRAWPWGKRGHTSVTASHGRVWGALGWEQLNFAPLACHGSLVLKC